MKYYEIQNLYLENISKNDLESIVLNNKDILEYYFILHDKDILDSGELKKEHFHLYIGFEDYGRYTIDKVREYFKPLSSRIFSVRSIKGCIRYLIHLDDKNKYQYCADDIFTNDIDKVNKALDNSKLKLNDVLQLYMEKVYSFNILNENDILKFFQLYGLLNYCVLHWYNLNSIRKAIVENFQCKKSSVIDKNLDERGKN